MSRPSTPRSSTPRIEVCTSGAHDRYTWSARARYHGARLAREGRALTDQLVGSLGYHEGADVTVEAMANFSRELRAAYSRESGS